LLLALAALMLLEAIRVLLASDPRLPRQREPVPIVVPA
jgi:hypothetical protein